MGDYEYRRRERHSPASRPAASRRAPVGRIVAASALGVLAFLAAGAWVTWAMTRPAVALVTADPADAAITLTPLGSAEPPSTARGRFSTSTLEPGPYHVVVERKGFRTFERDVHLSRGRLMRLACVLRPKPFALSVSAHPKGATVEVRAGGHSMRGRAPWRGAVAAGPVTVTVTATGRDPVVRRLFLDASATIDAWLDPKGQIVSCAGVLRCGPAPKAIALTPDGREAWTTLLGGPPSVEVWDLRSGRRVAAIDLGKNGAVEVTFSRNGKRAYASQMETARVFEIDTRTHRVLRSLPTHSSWTKVVALSPDGSTLFAANWVGNDVSEIDLITGEVRRRIPTVRTPRGLWPTRDGKSLYVAGFDRGDLARIDLATGRSSVVFRSGGALRHLVADEQRGVLYASDMARDCVWVHDLETGGTRRFVTTDHKPNTIDLSPDGMMLFVSCRGANNPRSYYLPGPEWGSVLIFDTRSGRPLDAVVGGDQCTGLDVSDDGRTLVFSDFLGDALRVYRVPPYATLEAGSGGRYPMHLADLRK